MTLVRLDNVAIVVADLDAAIAFFAELGMEFEARQWIEGSWADQTVGLEGVRSEIAMMRMPDGLGRVELTQYHAPDVVRTDPAPANTLGLHRIMFAVDDIDDTIERFAGPRRDGGGGGRTVRGHVPVVLPARAGGDHGGAGGADRVRTSCVSGWSTGFPVETLPGRMCEPRPMRRLVGVRCATRKLLRKGSRKPKSTR